MHAHVIERLRELLVPTELGMVELSSSHQVARVSFVDQINFNGFTHQGDVGYGAQRIRLSVSFPYRILGDVDNLGEQIQMTRSDSNQVF